MKEDNGSGLGEAEDDVEALIRLDPYAVIMGEHTPEYEQVLIPQKKILRWGKFPVWGPEQGCLKKGFAAGHIFHISGRRSFPAMEVMVGMVADCMPLQGKSFKYIRIGRDIGTDTKKGRLYTPFIQDIKNSRGDLGNGTVIEGEEDLLFRGRNAADKMLAVEETADKRASYESLPAQGRYTFRM